MRQHLCVGGALRPLRSAFYDVLLTLSHLANLPLR